MELQRNAMLMYTSCGWFFDELSGIETVQVIQYAGRVVQLAEELFGDPFEAHFLERLAAAKSNLARIRQTARTSIERYVKPVDRRSREGRRALLDQFAVYAIWRADRYLLL